MAKQKLVRLANKSNRVAKLSIRLEPGDEIEVPEHVLVQFDTARVTQMGRRDG